jgi:hypothetical protein
MNLPQQPMACCPECGEWIAAGTLRDGFHECDRDVLTEYQVTRARGELARLEWELACYLATPRARKLLAFRRFLEERDGRAPAPQRDAARGRRVPARRPRSSR